MLEYCIKWAMKLAALIECYYRCHKINVSLRLHSFHRDCQRFIFQVIPLPGTTTAGIFGHADDIKTALQIPLFEPFRKGVQIFLAVSTVPVGEISLKRILTSPAFRNSDKALPIALGCDQAGEMVIEDLKEMVHALYVGATGSGKSIGLLSLILSLVCARPASEVNLIVFDIGSDTLDVLDGIPHLSYPIIKDRDEGIYVVRALREEMERRQNLGDSQKCDLPAIVCVMDEFNSFIGSINSRRQEVVDDLSNLLRRGRSVNIHEVLATQEPKNQKMAVEIGNITSRMAFKVARFQTSVAILNCVGAEKLPGNGAFLYQSKNHIEPIFIQGGYISDDEAAELVTRVKAADQDLSGKFVIPEPVSLCFPASLSVPLDTVQTDNEDEQELASIILWTLGREDVSSLKIKEIFKMGKRADAIIEKLCELGLISEKFAHLPRKVLPQSVEDIPDEVMNLLTRRGVSVDDVAAALNKRNPDNEADHDEEHGHDATS